MLQDLFNKELSISEITRVTGHSRGTVRKYLRSHVPSTPQERSKKPSKLDGYREYIIQRLQEYPLSAKRIYREIQEKGFTGKYTIVKDFIREVRPKATVSAVYRYETKPGIQSQVDWAECGRIDRQRIEETLLLYYGPRLFSDEVRRVHAAYRCPHSDSMSLECISLFRRLY